MKKTALLLSLAIFGTITFCLIPAISYAKATPVAKITVTSPAFKSLKDIPAKYAKPSDKLPYNSNISIPLNWKVSKAASKKINTFAITIVDRNVQANKWVHLIATNIPADARKLDEGALSNKSLLPEGVKIAKNSFGNFSYDGPMPPAGKGNHIYEIMVYGLDWNSLAIGDDLEYSEKDFIEFIGKEHIVAKGKLRGKFRTPGIVLSGE